MTFEKVFWKKTRFSPFVTPGFASPKARDTFDIGLSVYLQKVRVSELRNYLRFYSAFIDFA